MGKRQTRLTFNFTVHTGLLITGLYRVTPALRKRLPDLYVLSHIRIIKLRRIRRLEHATRTREIRNACSRKISATETYWET